MDALKRALERWWRPFLFFLWAMSLTGLLKGLRYTAFLRPEFGYVLALGAFTLLGFLMIDMLDGRQRPVGVRQILTLLVLILPLLYLFNAQGVSLNNYAFQTRSLGTPSVAASGMETPAPAVSDTGQADSASGESMAAGEDGGANTPTQAAVDEGGVLKVTVLDLYKAPGIYEGKQVRFTGMVHRDDSRVEQDFGAGVFIVFRFVVTCCVADALPAAVLVNAGGAMSECEENSWVEVEGRFSTKDKEDSRIPFIENPTIIPTGEPKQPYLY